MEGVMHSDDTRVTRARTGHPTGLALMVAFGNGLGRGIIGAPFPISRAQSNKRHLLDIGILDFAISNDVCLVNYFHSVSLAIGPMDRCHDLS